MIINFNDGMELSIIQFLESATKSMGNCQAQEIESQKISKRIDKDIALELKSARYKNTAKLLLLGSGESGKSTILKQMKIIHQNGYTTQEKLNFKFIICLNIYHSLRCLLQATSKLEQGLSVDNRHLLDKFLLDVDQMISLDNIVFTPELGLLIQTIWNDPIVESVVTGEAYFPDSTQ